MAERPSLIALQDYATKAARRMFPEQKGVDDQQDAARHMLAAGLVAQRFGPGMAKAAGVGHEVAASPLVMLRSLFGGKLPLSYDEDTHNNAIGARLGAMTDSQAELESLVKMLAAQSVDINKQRRPEDQPWIGKSNDEAVERQTYGYAMGGVVNQPVQDEDNGFAFGGVVHYDPARVQAIVDRFATGGAVHMAKGGRKPLPMPVEGGEAIDVANPQDESAAEFAGEFASALPGAARRTVESNVDLAGLLARYVLGAPSQKAAMLSKVPGVASAAYEAAKTELPKIPARVASASPGDFGRLAAQYTTDTLLDPARLGKTQTMTNIIKPKGGNWVNNAEKSLIGSLIRNTGGNNKTAKETLAEMKAIYPPDFVESMRPESRALVERDYDELHKNVAIQDWLENKLTKYVKNEMGTEADPVRALAERGILHVNLMNYGDNAFLAEMRRRHARLPEEPVGISELAKRWENESDSAIMPASPYREQIPINASGEEASRELAKLGGEYAVKNPDALAYSFSSGTRARDLGFDHLVDELRNAINPESGLPEQLRLKPEDLSKVSVPQAVQLVDRINKWREKQKVAADLAKSNNPATFLHKEYPEGYRWVELKPPAMPEDYVIPDRYSMVRPTPGSETFAIFDKEKGKYITTGLKSEEQARKHLFNTLNKDQLKEALSYEGDVMGHCVGGYCDPVSRGSTRIFSLRDKKGQPHVTIQVSPGETKPRRSFDKHNVREVLTPEESERYFVAANAPGVTDLTSQLKAAGLYDSVLKRLEPVTDPLFEINQIKGKGNQKPAEKYIPFVQDFVKSNEWGKINDLKNANMKKLGQKYLTDEEIKQLMEPASRYIEQSPSLEPHRRATREFENFTGEDFSPEYRELERRAGMQVHPKIPYTYREMRSIFDDPNAYGEHSLGENIERANLLRRLYGEENYAKGGAVTTNNFDPARVQSIMEQFQEVYNA